MKILKIILVFLIFIINLLVAQPSFADDKPKLSTNRDYQEINQNLNRLVQARAVKKLPSGISSTEKLQEKIAELKYQKYIIDSSKGYGQCRNDTQKTLVIYGAKCKRLTSTFANQRYLLSPGKVTDEDWDCQGVFIPNDVPVAGFDILSAKAVKILDGTRFVIKSKAKTGEIEFNLPPAKVFYPGDVNWDIPDIAQANLNRRLPIAPID